MRQIRLLLVDDAGEVRRGLRTLLPLLAQASDVELAIVGEAANGREAVNRAVAQEPNVVLMDLAMPEMDGCAAARAIKAARPDVRVIAFSVHGDADAQARAAEAGMDAFVEKGAPMDSLLEAIAGSERSRPPPHAEEPSAAA